MVAVEVVVAAPSLEEGELLGMVVVVVTILKRTTTSLGGSSFLFVVVITLVVARPARPPFPQWIDRFSLSLSFSVSP